MDPEENEESPVDSLAKQGVLGSYHQEASYSSEYRPLSVLTNTAAPGRCAEVGVKNGLNGPAVF